MKLSCHWDRRRPSARVCSHACKGDLEELCTVLLAIDFAFHSLSWP